MGNKKNDDYDIEGFRLLIQEACTFLKEVESKKYSYRTISRESELTADGNPGILGGIIKGSRLASERDRGLLITYLIRVIRETAHGEHELVDRLSLYLPQSAAVEISSPTAVRLRFYQDNLYDAIHALCKICEALLIRGDYNEAKHILFQLGQFYDECISAHCNWLLKDKDAMIQAAHCGFLLGYAASMSKDTWGLALEIYHNIEEDIFKRVPKDFYFDPLFSYEYIKLREASIIITHALGLTRNISDYWFGQHLMYDEGKNSLLNGASLQCAILQISVMIENSSICIVTGYGNYEDDYSWLFHFDEQADRHELAHKICDSLKFMIRSSNFNNHDWGTNFDYFWDIFREYTPYHSGDRESPCYQRFPNEARIVAEKLWRYIEKKIGAKIQYLEVWNKRFSSVRCDSYFFGVTGGERENSRGEKPDFIEPEARSLRGGYTLGLEEENIPELERSNVRPWYKRISLP